MADCPWSWARSLFHGLPPELIHLVEEAGLTRFELEGDSRRVRAHQGLSPCAPQREVDQLFDELGQMKQGPSDLTFSQFVGQRNLAPDAVALATNYVEGFNAADASRISVQSLAKQQAAEDAIEGDRLSVWLKAMLKSRRFCYAGFSMQGATGLRPARCDPYLEAGTGGSGKPRATALSMRQP